MLLPLFASLALTTAPVTHELGHTSAAWNDPAQGGKLVTAEVWYPADVAGEGVAVAAAPAQGFPVLSFGHGFLMGVDRYAYLWEALVPRGHVMVLPTTNGGLAPDHQAFALDLAFVITALELESATPGSLFEGAIGERSAVMGHSMGGGASVLAASYDASIEAVCNLAAAETNPSAISAAAAVSQPALMLAGSDDCVTPVASHQGPIFGALASSCATLVVIDGASHCQFAEPDFICSLGELCGSALGQAAQHAATLDLVVPWLDAVLGQDEAGWTAFGAALASHPGGVSGACPQGPGPFSYCTAGVSASGCAATLWASGEPSLSSPSGFVIDALAGEGSKDGLFFYGQNGRQAAPWGNGSSLQCVVPPVQRTPLVAGAGVPGACGGRWSIDMNAHAAAFPLKAPAVGQPTQIQLWYRDPANASNQTTSLSDALEFWMLP